MSSLLFRYRFPLKKTTQIIILLLQYSIIVLFPSISVPLFDPAASLRMFMAPWEAMMCSISLGQKRTRRFGP